MAKDLPSFRFSAKAGRTAESPINYLMRTALEKPGLISLAAGFVDDETLPVAQMRRLTGEVLGDVSAGRAALSTASVSVCSSFARRFWITSAGWTR